MVPAHASDGMEHPPRLIKRYSNRKLYDTERSCYVTLDDIALMICNGEEVRVVDNRSSEDLTCVTLAQIIFEAEKQRGFMPLSLLRHLVRRRGEDIADLYKSSVDHLQHTAQDFAKTADRLRSDLSDRAMAVIKRGEENVRKPIDSARELVVSSQQALDDLQESVEKGLKGGASAIGRELDQLRSRLSELREKIEQGERDKGRNKKGP